MKKHVLYMVAGLALTIVLSGCVSFVGALTDQSAKRAAAEPLDAPTVAAIKIFADVDQTQKNKQYLGSVLVESQKKCQAYVNRLVTSIQEVNATGDSLTTLFSSAAAIATPARVAHQLSAGAAVISGTKSSINSNMFVNATIANISTAILKTYSAGMATYTSDLDATDDKNLVVLIEHSKISAMHALCSFAAADSTITSTLGGATANTSLPVSLKLAFTPPNVAVSVPAVLTITLGNTGARSATLSDTLVVVLDAGLVIDNPSGLKGTCPPGLVAASPAASTITYALGQQIPSGGCTIIVSVKSTAPSTYKASVAAKGLKTDVGSITEAVTTSLVVTAPVPPGVLAAPPVLVAPTSAPTAETVPRTRAPLLGQPLSIR